MKNINRKNNAQKPEIPASIPGEYASTREFLYQLEQEDIIYKTPVKVGDGLEIIGSGKEDYVIVAINGQQTYVPFDSFGSQVKEQVIKSLIETAVDFMGLPK